MIRNIFLAATLSAALPVLAQANDALPRIVGDFENQHTVYGNTDSSSVVNGVAGVLRALEAGTVGGGVAEFAGQQGGDRALLTYRGPVRSQPANPAFQGKFGEASNG